MIASSLVAAACAGYLVAAHRRDKAAAAKRAASKAEKAAALARAAARREDAEKRAEEKRAREDARRSRPEKKPRVPGDVRASAPEIALVRVEYEEDEDIEPTRVGTEAERKPIVSPLVFDADAAEEEPTYSRSLFLVSATAQTDAGMRRKRNEDSLLVDSDENLFAVADGMGGYRGGEVASRLAVEALRRAFHGGELPASSDGSGLGKDVMRLAHAVQAANDDILDTAKREHLDGMGTTVCAARFSPNKRRMFVGHVGDSRCYRLRDGRLDQMTSDHTMADLGVRGPQAAHLSRAVGIWPSVPIDVISAAPRPGDVYLLCSDGLTKMVPDAEIARVLTTEQDPHVAVDRLIALANANGGKDNVTVIVVRVMEPRSPSSSSMRRRSPRDSSPAFG